MRDPANRPENIALLTEKLKISGKEAERTYTLLMDPGFGFTPDAKFDLAGFKNVLALRAEIEGGSPAAPERYIDLGYYERAMRTCSTALASARAASAANSKARSVAAAA